MTFLKVYSKKLDEWDEFKRCASRYNHSAMGEKDNLFVEAINSIFFLLKIIFIKNKKYYKKMILL